VYSVVSFVKDVSAKRIDFVARCLAESIGGCTGPVMMTVPLQPLFQPPMEMISMPGSRLTLHDRVEIQCGIARGDSDGAIAVVLSKHRTTVLREIERAGGRDRYRAETAHARAMRCARRPKVTRLAGDGSLRAEIEAGLMKRWSPAAIAMGSGGRICAETIYTAVYAGARGPLSAQACRRLVSKRRRRRPRRPAEVARRANVLGPIRPVADRPSAAAARHVGHWEGDLIVGSRNRSAIVTLTCRASRLVLLADLPEGHGAEQVTAALVELFDRVPVHLRSTLTWDQGREMADWQITEQLIDELTVWFCEPHSPWQRPTNEQTNAMLRRWLPKGTDLSRHTRADLDRIENHINTMPRRLFNGKSAQNIFDIYTRYA
jgi:IS30 family transposase